MYSSCVEVTNSSEILTGRVKWFNNKTGFGFITVTDGSNVGSDIFVHHSSINVLSEQYKYLVQGEYVEFTLCNTPEGKHKFQAGSVKGIKGGQLMCETRREYKVARNNFKEEKLDVTIKNDLGLKVDCKNANNNLGDWSRVVKKGTKEFFKERQNELEPNVLQLSVPGKRGRKPKEAK
jgi:CspA family cold shock protein